MLENYAKVTPIGGDSHPVLAHLQQVINEFLEKNPRLSINAMSKRCSVSEPTLRRIAKGKVKTLPNVTTIVDILSYVHKTNSLKELVFANPGPISEFLKEQFPAVRDLTADTKFSEKLNKSISDSTSFVIYNLACSERGTSEEEVLNLFGHLGMHRLEELILDEVLEQKGDRFFAIHSTWSSGPELSAKHIKTLADFIKPSKIKENSMHTPMFANFTGSITKEAYEKIIRINRAAYRKTVEVLHADESAGDIPVFFLGAIDTLSAYAAYEYKDDDKDESKSE
ncbi:MAG: hypothetical protein HRT45_09800 [Bdellovibrionales bacterium]|nr:hypothetical protein [Bdellovibrionales bacterium]